MAETTVSAEVGFKRYLTTLLFLICGFLVMFMAAGFAMLESGMVTSKSVSVICAKEYWSLCNCWNYVLASWLQFSLWYS